MGFRFYGRPEDFRLILMGGDPDKSGFSLFFDLLEAGHERFIEGGFPTVRCGDIKNVDVVEAETLKAYLELFRKLWGILFSHGREAAGCAPAEENARRDDKRIPRPAFDRFGHDLLVAAVVIILGCIDMNDPLIERFFIDGRLITLGSDADDGELEACSSERPVDEFSLFPGLSEHIPFSAFEERRQKRGSHQAGHAFFDEASPAGWLVGDVHERQLLSSQIYKLRLDFSNMLFLFYARNMPRNPQDNEGKDA